MEGVYAILDGKWRVLVGLALHLLLCQCHLGAALDVASTDAPVLDMDAWAERARAHLEWSQGVSSGDSNGTWGGVGGSEPVSIPWQELWGAILNGNTKDASPLGRVRMNVREPGLKPLADLIAGQGGDVCIISGTQPATGLAAWLTHFLSTLSSPPPLHLLSVGLWVKAQQGLRSLRATVTGGHVTVRTIEGLAHLGPSELDGIQCKVGVVDLDSLMAPQDIYLRALLRSVLTPSTIAALGLRHVVLFTACRVWLLPFPVLAASDNSWSACLPHDQELSFFQSQYAISLDMTVGRFYDVDLSHAATSAAVQAVMAGEEELWVGEQHCRRAKAAQDTRRERAAYGLAARDEGNATAGEAPALGPLYIWITLCLKRAVEGEQPRLLQSLLASLLLPCQADLHVHITVNHVAANIVSGLLEWASELHRRLPHRRGASFTYHVQQAPMSEGVMRIFKPCAMLRLDMLHLLPAHVDRMLYLDTDTLLLTDVSKLWAEFGRFKKDRHAIGVVPDEECCYRDAYYREGRRDAPFWGYSGFNSGVLLLDLARLHDMGFAQRVQSILTGRQLANSTTLFDLGDQNVLNAVFAMDDGPEAVVELDHRWNYRTHTSLFDVSACAEAHVPEHDEEWSPYLLHGTMRAMAQSDDASVPVFSQAGAVLLELARDLVGCNNSSPSVASSQGLQAVMHKWKDWPQPAAEDRVCSDEPQPEWLAGNGTVFGRRHTSRDATKGGRRPCWRIEGAVERSLRKIVDGVLSGVPI